MLPVNFTNYNVAIVSVDYICQCDVSYFRNCPAACHYYFVLKSCRIIITLAYVTCQILRTAMLPVKLKGQGSLY